MHFFLDICLGKKDTKFEMIIKIVELIKLKEEEWILTLQGMMDN